MTEDFSWDASAREYAALYKKILRPQAARPSRRSR
jgi:glycogen synthase